MTPEGRRKKHLVTQVRKAGGTARKVVWQGRRGAPDWLLWWPGPVCAFVELKSDDGRLTKLQEHEISLLRRDGWRVYVCSTVEQIDAMIWELTHPNGCLQ